MKIEKILQHIENAEDKLAVQQIIEDFKIEKAKEEQADHKVLEEISKRALAYERRYLPLTHQEILEKLPAENRALLILVGKRESPVLISLSIIKPQYVVFIHTDATETTITSGLDLPDCKFEKIKIDPLHITRTYEQLASVVSQNKQWNWLCDITAGKKVMGASLAAFGFWRRIPVVYLDSQEVKGVAEPFSERLCLMENPYDCYGDPLLQMAQKSLQRFDFSSAEDALRSLLETTSLQNQYHKTEFALKFVQLYHQWDAFAHSDPDKTKAEKFYHDFAKETETFVRLKHDFLDYAQVKENLEFVKQLQKSYAPQKISIADPCRLVDIFCNAERRAVQEKFDDAAARLYRCVEMAATLILSKIDPDLNPDNVDWDAMKSKYPDLEKQYAAFAKKSFKNQKNGDILPKYSKLGLAVQITLAAALASIRQNSLLGENDSNVRQLAETAKKMHSIYSKHSDNNGVFAKRNRSILAHGTQPVNQKDYDEFRKVAMELCKTAIGEKLWQQMCQQAKFPAFRLI